MMSVWDDPERAREWPIESLSPWAAAVVEAVERRGGNGDAAYSSMFELADMLGSWEPGSALQPGQVWTEAHLRETRRRFGYFIELMRASSALVPEHPAWITVQLVDLLDVSPGLPALSVREIDRRTLYTRLLRSAERLVRTQFDLGIAEAGSDGSDDRRPETADDPISDLFDREHVRPRTRAEVADDLREEAARSFLPDEAAAALSEAATLVEFGSTRASAMVEGAVELIYREMGALGDFRRRLTS